MTIPFIHLKAAKTLVKIVFSRYIPKNLQSLGKKSALVKHTLFNA
jgi:hypothetical protein